MIFDLDLCVSYGPCAWNKLWLIGWLIWNRNVYDLWFYQFYKSFKINASSIVPPTSVHVGIETGDMTTVMIKKWQQLCHTILSTLLLCSI